MKRVKYTFILAILLACNLVYAAVPVYTVNQKDKDIVVTTEQPQFVIQLDSNPTTGYSWLLKQYDAKFIKVIKHQYIAPTNKLMGASGVEQWLLELTADAGLGSENTKLFFVYRRSWEQEGSAQPLVFTVISSD